MKIKLIKSSNIDQILFPTSLEDGVLHVDAERLRDEVRDDALVGAAELARLHHAVELAVGPVDLVLEDGERVRVEEVVVVGDDLLPPRAVVVAEVDEVQLGVGEVDALGGDVEGEAVGPVDLGGDDGAALRAVHADALDARVLS